MTTGIRSSSRFATYLNKRVFTSSENFVFRALFRILRFSREGDVRCTARPKRFIFYNIEENAFQAGGRGPGDLRPPEYAGLISSSG